MLLAGVGVQVGVLEVEVVVAMVELIVGLQEQAELYRAGAVPQAAEARLGKPVVMVLIEVVYVAQNAALEEYTAGLGVGKSARRQLGLSCQ